jgi:TAG lipase/steryl ester hydrolase/phospholipase A2/LPA acyltransferase
MTGKEYVENALKYFIEKVLPIITKQVDFLTRFAIHELPKCERILFDIFEIMFSPRAIFRQLAIISIVQTALLAGVWVAESASSLVLLFSEAEREIKKVETQLNEAKSYTEWKRIAERLDYLRGYDKWRLHDESSLFDCAVLRKRINDTMEMAQRGDVFSLMFRLRGGLARDQYGMQHEGLFSRAISGTKAIVERYHQSVGYALDFICDSQIDNEEIPSDAKLAFFNETRHAYGRSALLLSGTYIHI